MDPQCCEPLHVHLVSSTDSPEFVKLTRTLSRTSLVGLDAEWKPIRTQQNSLPTVSLLQIACRRQNGLSPDSEDESRDSVVFLLDLLCIPLSSIWELLRAVFVSPAILKLGFRFKQDLIYLSSTFSAAGCDPGFDKVEPFLDITSLYNYLQPKRHGSNVTKQIRSLATVCGELLSVQLSKELQCSDWSHRPLTEEQITYAAMDAHCLLEIFSVFQERVLKEGKLFQKVNEPYNPDAYLGLKELIKEHDMSNTILGIKFGEALDIVRATICCSDALKMLTPSGRLVSESSFLNTMPMEECLLKIVKKYGERILLNKSDKKPKSSKKKAKKRSASGNCPWKQIENFDEWQGPSPWDPSVGGDGFPKFLCDVMVEGLAKHLRCVGVDAAIPCSKKPEPRELIEQARKEKRVLLTRDAKLLRHEYLIKNQIYRVKSLLKNEQLLEACEHLSTRDLDNFKNIETLQDNS